LHHRGAGRRVPKDDDLGVPQRQAGAPGFAAVVYDGEELGAGRADHLGQTFDGDGDGERATPVDDPIRIAGPERYRSRLVLH
jgi:hypothetical protein